MPLPRGSAALPARGVGFVVKVYLPFMIAGKEQEGHDLFNRVDGLPIFWNDLAEFLTQTLRP